jgi:hypothetical protein
MNVAIVGREARIAATVHIHQPIVAFIKFRYTLENDLSWVKLRQALPTW